MNNFIKPPITVTFTAPGGGVVSGTAYLIGTLLVVASNTVAAALPFEGVTMGVFSLPKATGAWTEGQLLFWDNTAKNLTTTSSANTMVGVAARAQLSGDTTGWVRLNGTSNAADGVDDGAGVQDIVLATTAPDGVSEFLFVSTTGTKTDAVPAGAFVGQKLQINQYVAASSPIGTLTGAFKDQAGVAKTTLALGTATGQIGRFVWDGTGYRLTAALGGTGSGLT